MSSSNCCFLTCIQVSQEAGQVVWYSHFLQNFPQFIVIHTVKGFGIVNKAEIDVFLELSCFFDDPVDIGNLVSCLIQRFLMSSQISPFLYDSLSSASSSGNFIHKVTKWLRQFTSAHHASSKQERTCPHSTVKPKSWALPWLAQHVSWAHSSSRYWWGYVRLIGPTLEVREVSTPPRSPGIFVGGQGRMNVRKLDHSLYCHSHTAHDQILALFTVLG